MVIIVVQDRYIHLYNKYLSIIVRVSIETGDPGK